MMKMTKMTRLVFSIAGLLLILAACEDVGSSQRPAIPDVAQDTCGGAQYGGLIGRDATVLEGVLILRQVRVLRPDTIMTMDYRAERLNFQVGEDGTLTRIFCG
jgi:predicted component of type VI protein secretion system